MRKKIVAIILAFAIAVVVAACSASTANAYNKNFFDFTYHFNYAYVNCFGTVVEGKVASWNDWEDSDVMQVTFENGDTYYTHSSNIILVSK